MMGADDDDGAATRVWLGPEEELIVPPPNRIKWVALGVLLLFIVAFVIVFAVLNRRDGKTPEARGSEAAPAASTQAATALSNATDSGWKAPAGVSKTIEISAVGFQSFDRDDLGTLFDVKLRPLQRSPNLFAKRNLSELPRNEFTHSFTRVTSQLELGIVVAALLGGSYRRDRYYAMYRALDVRSVIKIDESAPLLEPPADAVFYLAELHVGSSYDVVIEGSARSMGAELDQELTGGVDLKAGLASANYHTVQRALGLRPRHGQAIFARSADEVADAYTTDGAAVPVRLVFRQIPGRKLPPDAVVWPTPFLDESFSLGESKSRTFDLPAGTYSVHVTTRPKGVVVDWGGARCKSGDFLELNTTCVLKAPTTLTITNWSTWNMGPPEEITLTLQKGKDLSAVESSREGH